MAIATGIPDLYERILIYGAPKVGKTRFATALTPRFGEALYFAVDPGSERLDSVLMAYRPRMHVVQSRPKPGEPYDPRKDAFIIAQEDWQKQYPGVRTLIWDTLTITSQAILAHIADTGAFSATQHISMGQRGSKEYQSVPMQGDYGAAQNAVDRLITFLFQQPLHVIVLAHEGYREATEGGAKTLIGGPLTVGSKTIGSLAGRFPTAIRLTRKQEAAAGFTQGKSKVVAWTETNSIWVAGVRSGHLTNPMPMVEVPPDPVGFWEQYDRVFLAQAEEKANV